MSKLKVLCFSLSADGFGAGPNQSLENPMGVGGMSMHNWVFPTQSFKNMHKEMMGGDGETGTTGIDNDFALKGFENIGAWILGRNMYSPTRGNWKHEDWKGWWGTNPPYHVPVYILTHYAQPPLEMEGGTTFYFVTEGIEAALDLAKKNANGKDIRLGGGTNTIRQYLNARLIDEMHLAIAPTVLGSGESFFHGINLLELGYELAESKLSEQAMHVVFRKK